MGATRAILPVALACATLLAACGAGDPVTQVRRTLDEFGRASRTKDYQTMCDDLLSKALRAQVRQVGLPCEVALRMGLESVRSPTLRVGHVVVHGDQAEAKVRTDAKGQRASEDTIELTREDGHWRIASLAAPGPPAPEKPR